MSNKKISDSEMSETMCAPGVQYIEGSCITLDVLDDIVKVYNNSHDDKIDTSEIKRKNPISYKKFLVDLLKAKMKEKYECDTERCWLAIPFLHHLSTPEKTKKFHEDTFKPSGPRTKEWLNTFNINDVFAQYEKIYKHFKFFGAHPRDFDEIKSTKINGANFDQLMNDGYFQFGFVFNLDKSYQSGSHWVSLYCDTLKNQVYYIDSVGEEPMQEFKDLMERLKEFCLQNKRKYYCNNNDHIHECKLIKNINNNKVDIRYNKTQHQMGDSECGVYSISFILRLLDGETFEQITKKRVSDEEIQLCRKKYFRGGSRRDKSSKKTHNHHKKIN